jgi:hypothetical protein
VVCSRTLFVGRDDTPDDIIPSERSPAPSSPEKLWKPLKSESRDQFCGTPGSSNGSISVFTDAHIVDLVDGNTQFYDMDLVQVWEIVSDAQFHLLRSVLDLPPRREMQIWDSVDMEFGESPERYRGKGRCSESTTLVFSLVVSLDVFR